MPSPTILQKKDLPEIRYDDFLDLLVDKTKAAMAKRFMLSTMDKEAQFKYLFDASSYDCNKIITAELFCLMMPELIPMFKELNLDSHHRTNVNYPIGTCLEINKPFGNHGLTLNKPAIVFKYAEPDERNKIFMLGLQADGTMGKGLYIYGINLFDAYLPSLKACYAFIEEMKTPEWISLSVYRTYQKLIGE